MGGFSELSRTVILAASSGASEGDLMTVYAYLFNRSESGSEFILVPMGKDFSKIPRWIAGSIGNRAPFPELHLTSDVPLPGINHKSLESEIEKYGYAVVDAHFELRLRVN
jgi:hypothetical protein